MQNGMQNQSIPVSDSDLQKQAGGAITGNLGQRSPVRPTAAPPVDVYENDDEILVVADMPGARSDSITIRLEKDELSISARRDADASGQLLAGGRRDCEYRRSFLVPRGVDAGEVTAEISQGVLRVHLPKAATAKPRVITVKASN